MELYNDKGDLIEGLTKEEHDVAVNEAIENYKKEHPENVDVTELQDDLNKANDDLKKKTEEIEILSGTDKAKNMAALREGKEKAETLIKDLELKMTKQIGDIKTLVEIKSLNETIDRLADGDMEMAKKIKFHYERNVKVEDDEGERKKKLGEAYMLAAGGGKSDVLRSVLGASGAPDHSAIKGIEGFSPELVGLASKLGISQEDLKNPKLIKQK